MHSDIGLQSLEHRKSEQEPTKNHNRFTDSVQPQTIEAAPPTPPTLTTDLHETLNESESEFDWDEDGDSNPEAYDSHQESSGQQTHHIKHHHHHHHHRHKSRSPSRVRLPRWHYLSPFMKQFIVGTSGSCVLIGVALAVHFLMPVPSASDSANPNFQNVRSNVQAWMWWAAFMWSISWLTVWFVEMLPKSVESWARKITGKRSEETKSRLEVSFGACGIRSVFCSQGMTCSFFCTNVLVLHGSQKIYQARPNCCLDVGYLVLYNHLPFSVRISVKLRSGRIQHLDGTVYRKCHHVRTEADCANNW